MSDIDQVKYLILIGLFAFVFISQLSIVIKNYKKLTPAPTNKLSLVLKIIETIIVVLVLFVPQIKQEYRLWLSLLVIDILALIWPFVIPSYAIDFVKAGPVSAQRSTFTKVRFLPEFMRYRFVWHGRFILILLVVIVFWITK